MLPDKIWRTNIVQENMILKLLSRHIICGDSIELLGVTNIPGPTLRWWDVYGLEQYDIRQVVVRVQALDDTVKKLRFI